MDKKYVKLLAKAMAQELILTATTVRLHRYLRAAGVKFDLNADREMLKSEYAKLTIPGLDPAWSDVLSSELAHELDFLLADIAKRVDAQEQ